MVGHDFCNKEGRKESEEDKVKDIRSSSGSSSSSSSKSKGRGKGPCAPPEKGCSGLDWGGFPPSLGSRLWALVVFFFIFFLFFWFLRR